MKLIIYGFVFVIAQILLAYGLALFVPEEYFNLMMFTAFAIDILFILYLITRPIGRRQYYFFEKGKHRARVKFNIAFGKEHFKIDFKIHPDCWVSNVYSDRQKEQVNNIWGISYNILPRLRIRNGKLKYYAPHHWNSRRIGFCSGVQENMFNMYLYEYKKGVKHINHIGQFKGDTVITVDTRNLIKTMNEEVNPKVVYFLYPYIGDLPAHRPQAIFLNVLY